MSGGNCPETPRQKMIGMMYLFLTAMLALNVSGELLKAFSLVDTSIQHATKTVESKNNVTYTEFEMINKSNPVKSQVRYGQSMKVKAAADSLFNQIKDLKELIIHTVDGPTCRPDSFVSLDNVDICPLVMLVEKTGERSEKLKKSIEDYKELLLGYVDAEDTIISRNLKLVLSTDNPPQEKGSDVKVTWEEQKFEHLPLAANMALFSSLQSNVRNTQADMTRYLLAKVDEKSFKFTSVAPLIIPKSQYVLKGNKYYAQIMMAATDSTSPPIVKIDGGGILPVENGRGIFEVGTSVVGPRKWSGTITINGPDGNPQTKTIASEYIVLEPSLVISPTKMNVFYEGVDNPVMVSVPGVAPSELQIGWTNVSTRQEGSQWIVKPNGGSAGMKCIVSVSMKQDGRTQSLGSQEFRIKRVPDPVAKVAKLREGKIKKTMLVAQAGVFAEMDNFDFQLEFKVSSFTVSTLKGGYLKEINAQGNLFTQDQQDLMKGLAPGSKVFFDNIKAACASNPTDRRSLGSISLTID